jgi:aspartate racemase
LSTTGTYISNVYPDCLSQHGLNGIQVSEKIQENHISPAIYSKNYGIKAQSNPVTRQAKKDLLLGIEYLVTERVEAIILGCTEIPLALRDDQIKGVPLIDATKVLARALILEISHEKLIEENG